MYSFDYQRAQSVADAAKTLGSKDEAKLLAGGMTLIPTLKQRLAVLLDHAPQCFGGCRHVEMPNPERFQRIDQGVGDRRWRTDRPGLAAAFDAERVVRAQRRMRVDLERRQVVRARHAIVHERAGDELRRIVIDRVLVERLADALRQAAVDLAGDDHRVDDAAEIIARGEVDNRYLSGFGVDFDFGDVCA